MVPFAETTAAAATTTTAATTAVTTVVPCDHETHTSPKNNRGENAGQCACVRIERFLDGKTTTPATTNSTTTEIIATVT